MASMTSKSKHLSVAIERPASVVYEYASDATNLPKWAAGLANTALEKTGARRCVPPVRLEQAT